MNTDSIHSLSQLIVGWHLITLIMTVIWEDCAMYIIIVELFMYVGLQYAFKQLTVTE